MSTVKENSLNVEAAQTALMYLRLVVDRFTGDSKLIQIDDLRLAIANITGLQALLDATQPLITGHLNELTKLNTDGSLAASGLHVGTFSTEAELAALVDDGTYIFVYDTAYVSLPLCGIVYFVAINNGHRILYTDNGLWHSVYFGGWGLERYIGGAFDNITLSYAEAVAQIDASQLSPGASYKITGTGQNVGIILRAASANEFETDGIVLALIPRHLIGTHSGIVWKGHWSDTLLATDVAEDDHFIYFGKVYRSLTGEVGTATNRVLDATNWYPLDPFTETDFYTQVTHGCSYKLVSSMPLVYTTGFIYSRWNAKGNTLSEIVEDADGFNSDMNDWHLDIDGGEFNGNILRRVYNNTIASTNAIARCSGNGDIYNTTNCDIIDCVLPDETNNIRNAIGASITKNVLGGSADIQYLATGSIIQNNTINGDVKGDISAYSTITLQNTTVGHTGEIKDNLVVSVTDSIIHGVIDSNINAELINTIMEPFATVQLCTKVKLSKSRVTANGNIYACDCATFMYENSVISTQITETLTANKYVRDDNTPFKATDGETFRLDIPVWDDIHFNVSTLKVPPSAAPTWTAFTANMNAYTWAVNDLADLGSKEYEHRFKEGEDVTAHLHVTNNGANNATPRTVKYTLYYSLMNSNVWTAEASLTAELTIPANALDKAEYLLDMGTIAGTGLMVGSQIKVALKRVTATGTAPINAPFITGVGVHAKVDTLGSRTISAK